VYPKDVRSTFLQNGTSLPDYMMSIPKTLISVSKHITTLPNNITNNHLVQNMVPSYSIITPTTAHIQNLHIKTLKTLQHNLLPVSRNEAQKAHP